MTTSQKPLAIVGIGASAGGIEAISRLVQNLNPSLGYAYIIVQHLSPHHESILPELIHNKTSMNVYQVKDGMPVAADNIYVIPPNAMMSIVDGHLKLSPHERTDGNACTIDFFLAGLSKIYRDKAIAVILSGTASDGTEGVKAIKSCGGITIAQDKSARFFSMPHNAIDSGFIDLILPPEAIAKELEELAVVIKNTGMPGQKAEDKEEDLLKIYAVIREKYGVDFTQYKPNTISRRIFRRMNLSKIFTIEDYLHHVQKSDTELDTLYQDLLISVTSFFRDPELYIALFSSVFPALLKNRHSSEAIRIWVPACASGEEACSIAIALFEYLGDKALLTPLQIFATDLSDIAIQKARSGIYSKNILENVSPERLAKYFIKIDGSYQVVKAIRDVCIFATHNLLTDPPFSRMDVISCQNVMIYLGMAAQQKILQSFHYSLKPLGYLLLGKSEGVSNAGELFIQSDKGTRIFTKTSNPSNLKFDFSIRSQINFPGGLLNETKTSIGEFKNDVDLGKEADRLLIARYAPPGIVVNRELNIVRFQGEVAGYLQPSSGKASLHILKMVKDDIVFELRTLLNTVRKKGEAAVKKDIAVTINSSPGLLTIEVIPIKSIPDHFLIVFQEKPDTLSILTQGENIKNKDYRDSRIRQLELQMTEYKDQIKIMTEEFDISRQQLQAAHEDMLSSNEELQSINEELETSKEELQSTNEELTTINEEVQRRNEDLKEAVNYAETIIETIRGPLLVLNSNMQVLTVNRAFLELVKTKREDIVEMYFYDMEEGQWDIPELRDKLQGIITKNKSFENFEVTHHFKILGNKTFLFNAIRLGETGTNKDRYLIAIEDITDRRNREQMMKANEERLNLLIQNTFDIITILSAKGDILFESESIEDLLGYKPAERVDKNIFIDAIVHPDDRHIKETMFKNALSHPNEDIRAEFRLRHKNGNYRIMEAVCINQLDDFRINGIIAHYRDVTERRMLEKQKDQFIGIASHELKTPVTTIKGYAQVLEQILSERNDKQPLELVKKMDVQINRLTNLIKDLLDVTQISEGLLKLKADHFDINELIKEVTEEIQQIAIKHKIENELQPVHFIIADREKIRQVLVNLISNAIKYSPNADKVVISSTGDKEGVTVMIEDFGIGIAESVQPKVFDRFFRVTSPGLNTYPGMGLGLYIVAEIIKKHNGTLSVNSVKHVGSTFTFTLPIHPERIG